jgi:REP element-mobilizing transposase RayT
MSQSLSKLYIHATFHIKYTSVPIRKQDYSHLHAYIGTVLNSIGCPPIQIGGVEDHIHILCILSKNIALAKLMEDVKRHSSRWIKTLDPYYEDFAWQGGYGCFSVSQSVVERVKRYIANQEQHHHQETYREEHLRWLNEYCVDYHPDYLFTD